MKQAEKSKETKKRIQEAAEKLFSEKGYEHTTMQNIIEESGMSRGAIYHQYESKQEILQSLTQKAQEQVREYFLLLSKDTQKTARYKIKLIAKYLANSSSQKNLIAARWVEKIPFSLLETLRYSIKQYAPLLANIIKQGIEAEEFECANPLLLAELLLINIDIWIDPVIFNWTERETAARFDYLAQIINIIAPGMITPDIISIIVGEGEDE